MSDDAGARVSGERPKAVLVGVLLPGTTEEEQGSSLEELARLGTTLGLEVIARVTQRRESLSPAAVIGEGKLRELSRWTGGKGEVGPRVSRKKRRIDEVEEDGDGHVETSAHELDEAGDEAETAGAQATVVLVDHDLTPSQARNLERATGAEVLDRSSVILSIFHRHARSREARLQVEIARLAYMAPRLREAGAGKDRQRGGVGGKGPQRGAGESALELDKRKIRDRIAELRRELEQIEKERDTRRKRRDEQATVALVGYTNAGKSSLMRALTASDVYVADELFATLDTTVRAMVPETKPRILVSDTVGFIKKLPHDLVASFRSTLAEAREAGLLVHVVDASDAAFEAQLAVTREVLSEIDAGDAPSLLVLNKADRLSAERVAELEVAFPDALVLSAKRPDDVARLHAAIVAFFENGYAEREIVVPYGDARRVALAHETCRVIAESFEEDGTRLRVRGPSGAIARLTG